MNIEAKAICRETGGKHWPRAQVVVEVVVDGHKYEIVHVSGFETEDTKAYYDGKLTMDELRARFVPRFSDLWLAEPSDSAQECSWAGCTNEKTAPPALGRQGGAVSLGLWPARTLGPWSEKSPPGRPFLCR